MDYLNTIQSIVQDTASNTDENMLICAPTGAGKTNIALLCVIREIEKNLDKDKQKVTNSDFKIIYVSPMKALAAEIVEKFQSRLKFLGVIVKELTGDMQLSKQEIQDTHVMVTTPEKWDVITRKSDGISTKLRLLILDEIHLLNDDRGPVIECIVARTLRNIERNQMGVRILGLSATLPNPKDVAQFIRVNDEGFFYFDARYRPIPLGMKFVGIKDSSNQKKVRSIQDGNKPVDPRTKFSQRKKRPDEMLMDVCYEMARKFLADKKQVMVFTHSRKDTIKTALFFNEKSKEENDDFYLIQKDHSALSRLRHKELQKLCPFGIGFHNAGLLRKDRNIVEKLFLEGKIRLLVTTATLAWGVNLPAYAVIIKGTDIYEPNKDMVDLSILDVQQIFGRAGRPQFDKAGEAILLTRLDKVNQYLGLMTNSIDIESRFPANLKEALNAEISLGSVTTLQEAIEWIKYTFFYIRMLKKPSMYKKYNTGVTESFLKRPDKATANEMIMQMLQNAIKDLCDLRLIRYDPVNWFLNSTDLGRISSHYYIKCETMAHFSKELKINEDKDESKIILLFYIILVFFKSKRQYPSQRRSSYQ